MGLKIYPGSFGVTGVKKVNHMKNVKNGSNLKINYVIL